MGGASINGNANFRSAYEPLLSGCFHIPAPYTYRNPFNESDPAKLADFCAAALEDEIAFQGAGTIAAFIMEPVLGAGGVIPPHKSFMPKVREICDRNGILLIAERSHHRIWPHGFVDRVSSLGCQTGLCLHGQSDHQWVFSFWCRDDLGSSR